MPPLPNSKPDQHGHRNEDGDSDAVAQGGNVCDPESNTGAHHTRRVGSENPGTWLGHESRRELEIDSPSLVDVAQPGQLAFGAAIPRVIIGERHHDTASEQRGGFRQRTRTQVQGRA